VEFGSGRSTLWLSERVASLTSVEHNPQWYEKVKENLEKRRASNVTYLFRPRDSAEEEAEDSAYVRGIDKFPMESLDFALVDGIYRSDCAKKTLERIRPGGILIIDNIEPYLPSKSMAPSARSDAQGHASVKWMQFQQCVQNWRIIWTSNGVWDTSIWIKPPQA
jgi:predicted O-methyltransferase YrrM